MIVKWPGVTRPGSDCGETVTSTDFYPTILEMAGLAPRPQQHCDGVSLVPLLKGNRSLRRKAVYWHYPHYHGSGHQPSGAIRAGRYKLIEFYEEDTVELYNLEKDIGETKNLAQEMPEKTKELLQMFHRWREQVGARMPQPNPGYTPQTAAMKPKKK
jgi:arylsulfatase A-like enzyme